MLWGQVSIWGHLGSLGSKGQIHLHTMSSACRHKCSLVSFWQHLFISAGSSRGQKCQYLTCRRHLPWQKFLVLLLFFLSGNTSFSHTSLHPILTKLGQSDRYLDHYSHTKDGGVRGHHGVTGVKKVIFTKKASSPSDYIALTRDLYICNSLTPSTKVMVLKKCPGSFGVTGVKSSFSPKRHQVLQIT